MRRVSMVVLLVAVAAAVCVSVAAQDHVGADLAQDEDGPSEEDVEAERLRAEEEERAERRRAKVMLHKYSAEKDVVEGMPFIVTYALYNEGGVSASEIVIKDVFPPQHFVEMEPDLDEDGAFTRTVDHLAPGASHMFNVTVEPNIYGIYPFPRAMYTYAYNPAEAQEDGAEAGAGAEEGGEDGLVRVSSMSSAVDMLRISTAAEYLRENSAYSREWTIFGAVMAFPTIMPFLLWRSMKKAHTEQYCS